MFVPYDFTNSPPEHPVVHTMSTNYAFDASNPRKLVGWADHVFIGKVIKQIGTKFLGSIPETQFEVKVLRNIKGELSDTVTVNQQGGFDGNVLCLFEEDQLLEKEQIYLFAIRYLKSENWHTRVPVYGDIPINRQEEKEKRIKKFIKAYKNQIPFTF